MKYIILVGFLVISCQQHSDHAHDAAGNHIEEDITNEIPRVDYTIWSNKTELFVEFPVLIVGKKSRFAAHFTAMDRHQAITNGKVSVSLIQGNKGIRHTVDAPSSPGIFTPILNPVNDGNATLQFVLVSDQYSDTLTIPNVEVYPNLLIAQKAIGLGEEDGGSISFLKEQAWKMEFQTEVVKQSQVFETIPTTGIWNISPSQSRTLIAQSSGKVSYQKKHLLSGQSIKKNEVVMMINSEGFTTNNLNSELELVKVNFQQAQTEYDRKKELFKEMIIPASEYERIEQKYEVAKANYESQVNGYSASGYTMQKQPILSPISGFLQEIHIPNGSYAKEGDKLFSIREPNANLLEIQIGIQYSHLINNIQDIWYKNNQKEWSNLKETQGSILSIETSVSKDKPTVSLFAQVNDRIDRIQGSYSEVNVSVGEGTLGLVIPVTALMEDYGQYSVIVQVSGESYERRNVMIGKRNGGTIQITNGLRENEVIVTKGAYQVKMQSMSGQAPAHGHAH